jgi:hypothetical protein
MWGANYTSMYNAASDLVDIIYGDEDEIDNLWSASSHTPRP